MIIKLTEEDDQPIFINVDQIQFFRPMKNEKKYNTLIHINGATNRIGVKEDAEDIANVIKNLS